MTEAYRSVLDISTSVKAGLLIRQTHPWAADVFIAAIVLHMLRIFFTGAYRKPRELTYWLGLTMLVTASQLEGYLGYSLVDDLLSGMGLAIGNAVALSIPFVGANVGALIWGWAVPGQAGVLRAHVRRTRLPRPGASLARAVLRRRGSPPPARRARPDQSDLALGALPHPFLHERRPAGLVPRLADRRAAARAELRSRRLRLHGRAQPVLGGVAFPLVVFAFLYLGRSPPTHSELPGDSTGPPSSCRFHRRESETERPEGEP
jgi:Cytochrome b(N-terminal)/b6/petB